MQVSARFEYELLAVEAQHQVFCMLELTAPPAPQGRRRLPFHLALVIDRSGSMSGRKLEVTKECAAFLIRRLAPTDELSLVSYDDRVDLLAPLAPVDAASLLPVIGSIVPGGTTNLSGGWLKGVETLGASQGDGPRKVLLLTDGLANVGVTDPADLVAMARGAAEHSHAGTTTIGFGDGFDEELLTKMAEAGRGNAYYAPTPEEAPGIFAAEFEGLVSLVAQNVSVEIRPCPEVKVLGILNEFPQVAVPGGVQLSLGDAFAEERRRVVFELHVPELASLGVANVAEVVVRYVSIGERVEAHELTLPLTVNLVSADEAAAAGSDAEVTDEVVVLMAARAQREARDRADAGDFDAAKGLLRSAARDLRTRAPESRQAAELSSMAESMESDVGFLSPATYDAGTKKRMLYKSRESQQRRIRPGHQTGSSAGGPPTDKPRDERT